MQSVHTLIKEGLETKGVWNYYHDDCRGTLFHASISKETKDNKTIVYVGQISMPDLKYKLESSDLFGLWSTMRDFAQDIVFVKFAGVSSCVPIQT